MDKRRVLDRSGSGKRQMALFVNSIVIFYLEKSWGNVLNSEGSVGS